MTQSNRKRWHKELKAYRFDKLGLMTQETAREQAKANRRDSSANYPMSRRTFKENAEYWGFYFPYAKAGV